jgi:hypothetical protein
VFTDRVVPRDNPADASTRGGWRELKDSHAVNDLYAPEVRTFDQRRNVDIALANLHATESIAVVAQAAIRRYRSGLLMLTDMRILFVMGRVVRPPLVTSIPLGHITDVRLEEQPLSGAIHVFTREDSVRFDLIRPKNRTWLFFWRLRGELERRSV